MLPLSLILLVLGVTCAIPTPPRVVNGTNAGVGEFPYAVSLRVNRRHSCGGSILNEIFIVTAGHCAYSYVNNPSSLSIQYGVLEITSDDTNSIAVVKIAIKENYEPSGGYKNDIAVLKLASSIPFNGNTGPITLPEPGQNFEGWPIGTLVGWGYPYSGGSVMTHLQKVNIYVYPFEDCKQAHGSLVDEYCHVCAGVPEGGKGQCSGDSGGPLTLNGVLVGTVSWSIKPCTVAGYPGVYARVAQYVDWIQKKVKEM